MAPVIVRSACFLALSKISRLPLAVVAYGDELYSRLGPPCYPIQFTHYRQLLSSLPLLSAMCGFHVCLLSKDIGKMNASLHIYGSVRNDQLWL